MRTAATVPTLSADPPWLRGAQCACARVFSACVFRRPSRRAGAVPVAPGGGSWRAAAAGPERRRRHGRQRAARSAPPRRSFVLFLESFAPLVNSLNLGIASPLVPGPPPLQLALIKTRLALQQLTSAAAGPAPPRAWGHQALLEHSMFGPRGASPQRPREANPSGATPPGPFPAGDAADLQRKPAPRAPQGPPRELSGQESFQSTLSHRIKVLVTLHRPDPRQVKEKPSLHQEQKAEARSARWDGAPRSAGTAGPKPPGPARGAEQSSNAQNRYTPESASSILASFGLSNEDLEELSRYPDDQLTPENMPLILREIRIRKMGHSAAGARSQSRGEETVGGTSGAAVKSKVIDYGHASKYGYTEDPLEVRAYDPEEPTEDPLEASVYNPEALGREDREDFQREQNVPVVVPPPSVPCSPVFPVEDLIKPPVFQNGSSNAGSFFPAVPARKVPPLCPSPVGLPVVKPVAQPALPAMPPVLPPILPPILPPLAQPILPPVMPPLVQQSVTQHIISPLPQPPFSAVLITTVSQHEQIPHERIVHEPGPSQPGAQSSAAPSPKPFQPEPEGPIRSPFGIVKASWLPAFLQRGAHRTKRWPTSTMMNDYYATSPRAFPHVCSLCSIECTHMEDWILHQNSTSHIESCRQLRHQYPDWNPESYSSKRNASERKENQTPKRRSGSGSRSPSPRRSRGSGSSSARRRSRSRSRSPGRYWPTRPRCWSPRPMRRPSPRHRSRSPQRSRNPLRSSPRPRRSASNDWAARRSSGSQDRKPSLETVVKTLRPDFVAEITKHKSLQAAGPGPSGSGKAPRSHPLVGKKPLKTRVSSKTLKKGVTAVPGSSSSPPETDDLPQSQEEDEGEEEASPGAGGAHPAADNRLLSEELLSFGTVLQISDLPDDGFTDQDIKNIFQPFGKVSDILVLRSRNEAFLEMNYKEAVIAAVKYGETVPVLVNGKRVKISVAEKPKESPGPAKAVTKKRAQTPKKAAPSTKKHRPPSSKTTKALPAKPPEAAEAAAAGSAGAEAQAAEPESGSGGDGRTEPVAAAPTQHNGAAEPAPAPEPLAQAPEAALAGAGALREAVADQEAPRAAAKSEEPPAPGGKEPDDTCVVLISNLPEKGYSVEEIFNLAKPFGGLRDVLILSSHKKAYLEINRKSADSMVKFYTCFAISLDGSQLCISMVPQFQTIKDEEAIFTTLIKDSDPKVNTETIHKQFVHLGNLPDDGYRELEVVCAGLRFGRVDHYVILKNKNKAILQLDSPRSARSMHSSLQHQPYTMGEHTLTCALSPRGHAAQAEVVKTEGEEEEPSRGSSGFTTDPEVSGAAQTAAAHPPAEPSVAKHGPASPSPSAEEAPALQTEPSEPRRDGAAVAAAPGPAPAAAEKVDAGVEAAVASVRPAAAESSQARSEVALPPSPAEKEEAVKDRPEPALFEPAAVSASEEDVEEQDEAFCAPALGSAGLSAAGRDEDVPSVGLAAGEPPGAVPAALPPEPDAPAVEMAPAAVAQTNQLGAPEKDTVGDAVKTEQEIPVIAITEKKPVLQTGAATEEQLDVAGADVELKAEEAVPAVGRAAEENPRELLVKTEAETEKKLEDSVNKVGTAVGDAPNAVSENDEGSSSKARQSKGTGAAKTDETHKAVTLNSSLSIKDSSCVGKTILKAVVYLPDISKSRCPAWRNQPCLWKGGRAEGSLEAGDAEPDGAGEENGLEGRGSSAARQVQSQQELCRGGKGREREEFIAAGEGTSGWFQTGPRRGE
ncbi:hypothetical protein Q9966_012092 [Columba livia]|nr:hypothetical protein Q9966_012092 [Columba livia]